MIFRNVDLNEGRRWVRVVGRTIAAVGDALESAAESDGEEVIDGHGGALLPGLHDHHLHLLAMAAAAESVALGPPVVRTREQFTATLRAAPDGDWVRGVGYHESVAGELDRGTLDEVVSDRPVRVQHRSGRMWFFNSAGLARLLSNHRAPAGLEREGDRYTGRLFDEDTWLRQAVGSEPPSFISSATFSSG